MYSRVGFLSRVYFWRNLHFLRRSTNIFPSKKSYINNEVAQFRKFWKNRRKVATIFSYKNTLTIIFTFYCIRKRIPATKNAPILFAFVRPTSIFLVLQNLEFDPESSFLSKKSLLKQSRFEAQKTHLLYKHSFYYFEHNLNEVECSAMFYQN